MTSPTTPNLSTPPPTWEILRGSWVVGEAGCKPFATFKGDPCALLRYLPPQPDNLGLHVQPLYSTALTRHALVARASLSDTGLFTGYIAAFSPLAVALFYYHDDIQEEIESIDGPHDPDSKLNLSLLDDILCVSLDSSPPIIRKRDNRLTSGFCGLALLAEHTAAFTAFFTSLP